MYTHTGNTNRNRRIILFLFSGWYFSTYWWVFVTQIKVSQNTPLSIIRNVFYGIWLTTSSMFVSYCEVINFLMFMVIFFDLLLWFLTGLIFLNQVRSFQILHLKKFFSAAVNRNQGNRFKIQKLRFRWRFLTFTEISNKGRTFQYFVPVITSTGYSKTLPNKRI